MEKLTEAIYLLYKLKSMYLQRLSFIYFFFKLFLFLEFRLRLGSFTLFPRLINFLTTLFLNQLLFESRLTRVHSVRQEMEASDLTHKHHGHLHRLDHHLVSIIKSCSPGISDMLFPRFRALY